MKHLKILGLLAVSAAAMMAFAASASATTVTGPSGETTPTIHAVHDGLHVELHNAIANITCNSTVSGTVSTHGKGVTASGPISHLTFNNCTNNWTVDVEAAGSLEIHWTGTGTGHGVGTLTSNGATVTATHTSGLKCGYRTENTHIGTLTGGTPAKLKIEAVIPRHAGSPLCGGSTAAWTGSYVTTGTIAIDKD